MTERRTPDAAPGAGGSDLMSDLREDPDTFEGRVRRIRDVLLDITAELAAAMVRAEPLRGGGGVPDVVVAEAEARLACELLALRLRVSKARAAEFHLGVCHDAVALWRAARAPTVQA